VKFITSRDNAFFKRLIKLAGATKERRAAGLTLLDGVHLISAYQHALGPPESLIISQSGNADPEIKQLLAEQGGGTDVEVIMLPDNLFREISPVKSPTGIMALVPIPSPPAMSPRRTKQVSHFTFCSKPYRTPVISVPSYVRPPPRLQPTSTFPKVVPMPGHRRRCERRWVRTFYCTYMSNPILQTSRVHSTGE